MPSLEEYVEEIKDMWDTHWLTNMGPKHKKFQEELKQYLGVENIDWCFQYPTYRREYDDVQV